MVPCADQSPQADVETAGPADPAADSCCAVRPLVPARHLTPVDEDHASPLFTAVFQASPVAMGIAEVGPDGSGSLLSVNSAYSDLLGFSADELRGRGDDLVHPDDQEMVRDARCRLARGELTEHVSEIRVLRRDGTYMWGRMSRATIPDSFGRTRYVLAVLHDVTEDRRREEELADRAHRDPLTGLLNRAGLHAGLPRLLAATGDSPITVTMIDLDGFKQVNDELGHGRGDELLVATARALEAAVRPTDLVARLGGDEFVVAAPVSSPAEGVRLAERLAAGVSQRAADLRTTCSASVGVALTRGDVSVTDLLESADRAMYAAKQAGKGLVRADVPVRLVE